MDAWVPVSYTHLDVYKRQTFKKVLFIEDITVSESQAKRSVLVFCDSGLK